MTTIRTHAQWTGGYATRLEDGRDHHVTVDLPTEEGGMDSGPSALELSLLALAGCVSTTFALIARKRKVEYQGLWIELEAEKPPRSATITSVVGDVHVITDARFPEVETVLERTVKTCPVGVLFERAHVPVELHLHLGAPPGHLSPSPLAPAISTEP